jgi:hypothetical protein
MHTENAPSPEHCSALLGTNTVKKIIETSTDIHLVMEFAERGELFDYIVKHKRL